MRAVVSRVQSAHVSVTAETGEAEVVGGIDRPGLLVLLGITATDTNTEAAAMARKLFELRILRDELSCASTNAPLLIISQFTLYGDTRKGRRPSWTAAARPEVAKPLVSAVVDELCARGATVSTGRFGAEMAVHSVNDGPFTVIVEI
jgi:D-tyrosyl-tRNA(Tyr) deacylase